MARDPAYPHSATSQFFINLKDNGFLDRRDKSARGFGYAVFGKVVKGMDVVDKVVGTWIAGEIEQDTIGLAAGRRDVCRDGTARRRRNQGVSMSRAKPEFTTHRQ